MKLSILKTILRTALIIAFVSATGLLQAVSSNGQDLKDVKLSLDVKEKKLTEIFELIEKKTNYVFAYPDNVKSSAKQFTFSFRNESLEQVLARIGKEAKLKFKVVSTTITAVFDDSPAPKHDIIESRAPRAISGQITAEATKDPLPGVNIYRKGTTIGTISDVNGNYQMEATDQDVLVFSFIGFETFEAVVGSQSVINVSMREDIKALEEIIVVGYGEQKRSNLTGAISSVSSDGLENKSVLRLDQALQGMAAGVTVARDGGAPGATPTIHIRGVGSINDTNPIWVVDGIRMETGNHFDVDDVESIEVLKDASASAIYGVKAAHGVILVTTKRGKGDVQVNFKSSFGKRTPIRLPQFLNSADFVKYKKESRLNAGQNPEPAWDNYEYDTDWIDAFYDGSGTLNTYDLSVSKGDEKSSLYVSLGHDSENGILIDNWYKRYSLRVNSDLRITDWLRIGESTLLSKVIENPIGNNNENYSGGIPYRSIPIMPIRDAENPYGGWGRAPAYFQGPNPVATQYQQHEERNHNRIDATGYLEFNPVKSFMLRASGGYNLYAYTSERFNEAFSYGSFSDPINSLTYSGALDQSLLGNVVATYTKSFNNRHHIKAMAGYEVSLYKGVHFNVGRTKFLLDEAWAFNIGTGDYTSTDPSNRGRAATISYFSRVNYDFDEKYLIEANIRRDASAPKFAPDNLWGVFHSFSLGWRISQEKFFENVPYINSLKLRASTGSLGSDRIGDFQYMKTYTSQFSTYAFDAAGANKVSGFYIARYPNGNVGWEEINTTNVAFDLKAFDSKLSVSADFYIKDTKDLLYQVPVPLSIGIATHNFDPVSPPINIGTLRNSGVDIELGYNTEFQKFSLNLTGNVSFLKNEMKGLNNGSITGGSGGGQIGGMTRTEEGAPISSFYGFVVQQMLHTDYEVYAINTYAADGLYQEAGTAPGDFMYVDINGDGEVTAEHDRTFIGNPWPKMTYGLNASLSYNNMFDLMLQFQGVQGVDIFNANKAYSRNFFGDNNTTTDIFEAWTPEKHTEHPRNIASDPNGNWSRSSTYFVENGSYLKLRNVQLGFTVPTELLQKIKVKRARAYLNLNNILTLTKYSGIDPEIAGSNIGRGVDYGMYPQVRTYTVGLEVQL